jgi:RNA polymerase sporulation-specific sigma factor
MVTDEQLCAAAQCGDTDAMDELVRRYTRLVHQIAKIYYMPRTEKEDIIQEGLAGLVKAVRDYKPNPQGNFGSFAALCIRRRIITAVKSSTRSKHQVLNQACSFETKLFDGNDNGSPTLGELLPDEAPLTEDLSVANELTIRVREAIVCSGLSEREAQILEQYMQGHSYKDIAQRVGVKTRSVDNALQRGMKKVQATLSHYVAEYYGAQLPRRRQTAYIEPKNPPTRAQAVGMHAYHHKKYCVEQGRACGHDQTAIRHYRAKYEYA